MSQSSTAGQSSEGAPNASAKPPPPPSSNMRLVAAYILAALLTGIAAAAIISREASSDSSGLQTVARADLDSAIVSMNQSAAAQAVDDARQCKAPLAYVVLQAQAGPAPLSVRIRSGAYLSPWMQLTESPRRVAIPFPAPYVTGKGELFVEGALRPVTIWLTPGRIVSADPASAHIPVVWTPANPC
jgi:hypothetical protein